MIDILMGLAGGFALALLIIIVLAALFGHEPASSTQPITLPQTCTTCGCKVALGRGKQVDDDRDWRTMGRGLFYCDGCAPPYDQVRVLCASGGPVFYKTVPTHVVEVTEKGKERA